MIQVRILKCLSSTNEQKNGTFTMGKEYFCKMSYDGRKIVAYSNEGFWIPLVNFQWARSGALRFKNNFQTTSIIYVQNKKVLHELISFGGVEEFYDDLYKCKECGLPQPYCSRCVL